ncbi:MAG: SPOR domain-containing protein [Proteobacteria bacterium]|nr:SPOR domain-containing protein [Pseudomonadota bacterium]NCA27694.1 SPOR domain-containing protein [Pseudomonadota bacterium]
MFFCHYNFKNTQHLSASLILIDNPMKKFQSTILAITIICLSAGCTSKKNSVPEIRFVDLQGNARPIKTRVPEANAKIISGQNVGQSTNQTDSNPKIQIETNIPKDVQPDSIAKQSMIDGNQKVTDSDNYNTPDSSKQNSQKNIYQTENPIVEYDLSKDYSSQQEESKKRANLGQINSAEQDINNPKSVENNQQNLANKSKNPIITYSAKNIKKSQKGGSKVILGQDTSSEAGDTNTEDNNSLTASTDSRPEATENFTLNAKKYYVQVGSFNNSKSAKNKITKIKNQGKGKITIAYINNKKVYRSVFGPYNSRAKANSVKNKILQSGNDAIVIKGQ